jgi:glucosamine--fructose-6-phosphate aminotransferase (isomerizing)
MPTREKPIPDWLAVETARLPLWYIIREATEARTAHPYVLYREIKRQPDQWEEIQRDYWGRVAELAGIIAEGGTQRVITTGCGSAFFTAMHGEFTLPRVSGLPATAIESFELAHYFPDVDPATTLVIGHSGTGGSIETVEAMREARRRGCLTLAITNTEDTAVGRASDLSLTYVTRQECGPCISVVSTRILLVTMLAVALARGDRAEAMRDELRKVTPAGRAFLDQHEEAVRQIAARYHEATSWLVVGSGPHYFSAREGTLKIEEQANLIGKALRTGDFHHDSLSVLQPDRVVVAIEAAGSANDRVVDVVRAAREGRAPTVAVTWSGGEGAAELTRAADHRLRLDSGLSELVSPIPMTLVFQLLGYHLAVARGRNPDTLMTDHEANTRAWLTSFPLGTH